MRFRAVIEDQTVDFHLHKSGDEVALELCGKTKSIDFIKLTPYSYSIIIEGKSHFLTITEHLENYNITIDQNVFLVKLKDENDLLLEKFGFANQSRDSSGEIRAPIPGLVSTISVKQGQKIKIGGKVLILEAMKMENEIDSPITGIVEEIFVSEGQSVEKNSMLVKLAVEDNGNR